VVSVDLILPHLKVLRQRAATGQLKEDESPPAERDVVYRF